MNILMVEDERMVARGIKRLLGEILGDRINLLVHAEGLADAETELTANKFDLMLLDLNLSGDEGFDLLSTVVAQPFQTIIVSANTDQALRSYEYGVLDFVPKPVSKARLTQALDKFLRLDQPAAATGCGRAEYLSVRSTNTSYILKVTDIALIQSAGKYSEIRMKDGASHLHEKSLSNLLQILPTHFQRIHKSTVVSLNEARKINSYEGSRYELELVSGEILRVGRAFITDLREQLS